MNDALLVERLDTLIDTCRDGELGFRSCAGQAESMALQWLLTRSAQRCAKAAAELQALRAEYTDVAPARSSGARRGWVSAKSMLAGFSDLALLAECERGQEAALQRYRRVLDEDLPIVMRAVALRHCDAARDHRAQMRSLRATLQTTTRPRDRPAAPAAVYAA